MSTNKRIWARQPPYARQLDWSNALLKDVDFVLLGSQLFFNPAAKRVLTYSGLPASSGTGYGLGPVYSTSAREYVSFYEPVATGGTNEWTIAGIFMPTGTLYDNTGASGQTVVGNRNDTIGSTRDRSIKLSSGKWAGYLYDGVERLPLSTFGPVVGRPDRIVVISKTSAISISVNRETPVSVATSSNGYNAYTTAQFFVGNASPNTQSGGVSIPLLIRARRAWTAEDSSRFFDNPWQIFTPRKRRLFGVTAAVAGGFKAAYARGSNSVINAGNAR